MVECKRNNKKIILLCIFVILEVISIFLMYKSLSDKETQVDNVSLNKENIINKDMFAIMLNDGSGNYTESSENNFSNLSSNYKLNHDKSGCIDMNGNEIDVSLNYNSDTKKLTVNTNKTSYCYLYFDNYITTDELVEKDNLWNSGLEGDGYRYVGNNTDSNPNNYICFGTIDKEQCTNEPGTYMYRIIGVFKDVDGFNHMKLIKKESQKQVWHSTNDTLTNWGDSASYSNLNGNGFLTNNTYMPSGWESKITKWTWRATSTGTFEGSQGPNYIITSPKGIYQNEILKTDNNSTNCCYDNSTCSSSICAVGTVTPVSAKIGLMYASDYALSLGDIALSMITGIDANKDILKTGWMYLWNSNNDSNIIGDREWIISRVGNLGSKNFGWYLNLDGSISYIGVSAGFQVRPVFYLNNNIAIKGSGTQSNPYIIVN